MAKKKTWFSLLKRLFISESESRLDKGKRKRWVFTRLKIRRLEAASALSPPRERRHQRAEEKQSKCDIHVDAEKAAEANSIVNTSSEVEPEVVSLIEATQPSHEPKDETPGLSNLTTLHVQLPHHFYLYERKIENLAAIRIQTAFRGYLSRKALRALKGLVRLQAIIRGRAVRRQAIATLKSLQSIVSIQSEVCAKRCEMVKSTVHCAENKLHDLVEKDIKIDLNSQRQWDGRVLSKEESNKLFSSKREAAMKRDRIREYWLSHRRSTESESNGRRRYWLEQWVDAQLAKRDDLKNLNALFTANARTREESDKKEHKSRTTPKQHYTEGLVSPVYVPRRSFQHRRQQSSGDDTSYLGSPSVPTYMAATESAKAKARSMSSPRLRPINTDVYSEINSPYKYKLSPISSINSEVTVASRIGSVTGFSQRSPCLKGTPGPIKSTRSLKDLSFESDSSFSNWDRIGGCR